MDNPTQTPTLLEATKSMIRVSIIYGVQGTIEKYLMAKTTSIEMLNKLRRDGTITAEEGFVIMDQCFADTQDESYRQAEFTKDEKTIAAFVASL